MSCMHSKFEGLIMMKHALINALCNMCFTELSHLDSWGYVLCVTIFILVIMNAYPHISYLHLYNFMYMLITLYRAVICVIILQWITGQ